MLKVENLEVTYPGIPPTKAVRGISFELQPGKTTVLIGPSGSGKTATISAILGQLPDGSQAKGTITVSSAEQSQEPNVLAAFSAQERGSLIGWVPQDAQRTLSPTRSIGSLLKECLKFHQPDLSDPQSRIHSIMDELDLPLNILKAFPHQLSGGQRQRCMLAIALIKNPQILIADEPTTALDSLRANQWLSLISGLKKVRNLTILLITHDERIADRIGDHFLYMNAGKLVEKQASASTGQTPDDFATDSAILHISNLSVRYASRGGIFRKGTAVQALKDVSFKVMKGEIIGIAGESGSGKSTLAKCLVNLLPYTGGIDFKDEADNRIQLILQDSYSSLHPAFTILSTLEESLRIWQAGLTSSDRKEIAAQFLNQVQLPEAYLEKYPGELSGGERQRVAIARALIAEPRILILDESISSLDYHLQQDMISLVKQLVSSQQLSLLVISHDLGMLRQICHRLLIIHEGQLIETGQTSTLLQSPSHPQTQRLLAASGLY